MKHVYVGIYHDGMAREVVCVAHKRKALRRALEQDWLAGGHAERPLLWRKGCWTPFLPSATKGGLASAPYTVEKHGVL